MLGKLPSQSLDYWKAIKRILFTCVLVMASYMTPDLVHADDARVQPDTIEKQAAKSTSGGYELDITPIFPEVRGEKQESFRPGEPVLIDITVSRSDSKTGMLIDSDPNADFTVEVKEENGTPVPLTRYGRKLAKVRDAALPVGQTFVRSVGKIQPSHYTINVNRHADITIEGTYDVKVSRTFGMNGDGEPIATESKIIQIVIK